MIKIVANEHTKITFYKHNKTVEIQDSNGIGVMGIEKFKELKDMIDFMWGSNSLWRYTSDNEPTPLE